jgi:predicted nuclease of predicted toxin-antitoxin system
MNIYLDDNRADRRLAALLQKAGHAVVCPVDVGLSGASDARHLTHAISTNLVVLTNDSADYQELHNLVLAAGGGHPGILVIRYDDNPKHDMKPRDIVAAIAKLEQSGVVIANDVIVLNHWR